MKVILRCIVLFMLINLNPLAAETHPETGILGIPVTITVHPAETLESIIFRLDSYMNQRIEFNCQMLQGYKAKSADYQNVPLSQVLKEQLADTHLKFYYSKKKIWIVAERTVVKAVRRVPAF